VSGQDGDELGLDLVTSEAFSNLNDSMVYALLPTGTENYMAVSDILARINL